MPLKDKLRAQIFQIVINLLHNKLQGFPEWNLRSKQPFAQAEGSQQCGERCDADRLGISYSGLAGQHVLLLCPQPTGFWNQKGVGLEYWLVNIWQFKCRHFKATTSAIQLSLFSPSFLLLINFWLLQFIIIQSSWL